jgi:regulatory protein
MQTKNKITPAEALGKLQKICSVQEKCSADTLLLLKRWGVDQKHHPEIITRLKSEQFIDESRFAAAFVRDKVRLDCWGLIKIRYFLKQKGIPGKMVEEASSMVDKNDYKAMISRELAKKKRTLKGTPREIWAKLARHGASRGYEMDMMRDFLDEIAPDE